MADEAQTVRSINWREVFPFTNLFKAFRVAVHPSKLFLALAALLLIYFGGRTLDVCWPKKHMVQPSDYAMWRASPHGTEASPRGIFITFFDYEIDKVNSVAANAIAGNFESALGAVLEFAVVGPSWLLSNHWVFFFIFGAWFLLIWSVFGGAISRIAAVHVARDEKISVRQAVRFSLNKLLSFVFAPLIPILILLVIGVVLAAAGWLLFHIPYIGPIVAAVFFFLALVAGLVMALVLLGLVGGYNLMYPTVAVEGSDSFDAISRSFSYVFARPWRMLFYTVVAVVYGAATYLFVRFFILLMLGLTHYFVSWWFSKDGVMPVWVDIWPTPGSNGGQLVYSPNYKDLKWSEDMAAGIISIWVYLVIGLLGAYAISFYFSANTIIYYLMRREVDATELEDVYVEETEDEFADAATAGAPGGVPAATNIVTTTVSSTTVAVVDTPLDSVSAPSDAPKPDEPPPQP